jgi:hypothetical protein
MGDTLLAHAGHITEFFTDPAGNHWNGTCTQTALEVCLAALDGRSPSLYHMALITRDMVTRKMCQSNGGSTLAAIAQEARNLGYKTPVEWDFQQPLSEDWHDLLLAHAGIDPILLQVANGAALVDAETGARDESGLHYHALAIVGKQQHGYICADGDNPQVQQRFQIYTWADLTAAVPCGLLMVGK